MKTTHREIEFGFGNIDSAIKELQKYKEKNELVFGVFNGQKLFSDTDDLDSAYLKITGRTKEQFDEEARISNEKYQEEKKIHEETIPEQTKEWIARGEKVLDLKYLSEWNRCVPIRLGDLYKGWELASCLEIVGELNEGVDFKTVKEIIDKQCHSGMSFGLVCAMIKSFSDRGADFVDYINK